MAKAVIRTRISECTAAPICGGLGKKVGCSQPGKPDIMAFQKFILMFGGYPYKWRVIMFFTFKVF